MGFIGFFFIPSVAKFSQQNPALLWVALVFSIILGLFTLCEGWLIGAICSTYEVTGVLIAVGMTAGVVFALTLFAMQTKVDFTARGGALLCVLVVFILAGFIAAFFPQTRSTRLVFAIIGAIIFSLSIVFDTQMMMG